MMLYFKETMPTTGSMRYNFQKCICYIIHWKANILNVLEEETL